MINETSRSSKPTDLMNFDDFLDLSEYYPKRIQKKFGTKEANVLLNSFFESRSEGYSKKMSSPPDAEESCSNFSLILHLAQ